jgi:hypothetical protein
MGDRGRALDPGRRDGGGWIMLAKIGVLRALHCGVVQEFNPERKDPHWGKRKLKRNA